MPTGNQTKLYKFQQDRPEPPSQAEGHLLSDLEQVTTKKSKFCPAVNFWQKPKKYSVYTYHCPSCLGEIQIDHGDRIECRCGLFMENYGNSLVIWR